MKIMSLVHHSKLRRFRLNVDELHTLEDVKKILHMFDIRIQSDSPAWEEVGQYFTIEVVPKGYIRLLEKIGHEGIAELDYHEIEEQARELLDEDEKTD